VKVRAEFRAALLAGAVAGTAGFGAFLLLHAIWIVPIWSILPAEVWAVLGGVCVGWAYDVHRVRLPRRPAGRVAVVFASASLVLTPGLLLLPLQPPRPDAPTNSIVTLVVGAIAGLLLLASPLIAATIGGLLGRSARAAIATGLAAFTFLSGLGHNIPVFGFGWRGVKMWTIMLTVTAIASVTLVVVEAWTSAWLRPNAGSSQAVTASKVTR
jgi:hypothetical protein